MTSQKRLDRFAAFIKNIQTIQGRVEYQAEDQGRRLANTVHVKQSEVRAGREQSE